MRSLMKEHIPYKEEGNIVRFIFNDEDRPRWSKILNDFLIGNHIDLQMEQRYKKQKSFMLKDEKRRRFVEFVSRVRGVKVDLASGPSGYFSPFLETLTADDTFIVTDACPAVIAAHSAACDKEHFHVFDVDLDRGLPFKDESVDIFSGNLLNNVEHYAELIREAYRCLKHGGKLAVIEMFFDHGCKTYAHLNSQGAVWASFETFIAFCENVGFIYLGGDIIGTRKGKIDEGDLYPLDDGDCSSDRTVYFEKP